MGRGLPRLAPAPCPRPGGRRAGERGGGFCLLLLLSACGYHLSAGGAGHLPAGAEQVFVRALEDRTTDAELGALVAAALRQELARRGATGGPSARARIEGVVDDSAFGPWSPNGEIWFARLGVSARLLVDGKTVAEHRAVRTEEWLAGQDPLESEGRRRLALRRATETVARELIERFAQR